MKCVQLDMATSLRSTGTGVSLFVPRNRGLRGP
jgi:hypothetical protein